MKVLFLHGWRSVPGGVKPTFLVQNGLEVINPKLDDDDFEKALRTAQDCYDQNQPEVIVGSSRGGAVAMNLKAPKAKLVLLCPAWKNWGRATRVKSNTIILHSRHDDVIPYQDSEELASGSQATLLEVGQDHRLADEQSLEVLLWACQLSPRVDRLSEFDEQLLLNEEASYVCDSCGEQIVIPLDLTEGSSQTYVEDCPVCCHANIIHVHVDVRGNLSVTAEREQD
jgi:predicted esterase YcpF (UPF0227 family)/DNA-directed RNA polymerase subunit RPC12/RpoP